MNLFDDSKPDVMNYTGSLASIITIVNTLGLLGKRVIVAECDPGNYSVAMVVATKTESEDASNPFKGAIPKDLTFGSGGISIKTDMTMDNDGSMA